MEALGTRSYWLRFLIASASAFVLVTACSISMQLHVLRSPEHLLAVCLGVLVISIPSAAVVALVFRRGDLPLILSAQVLTVVALASWFGLRA